MPCGNRVGTWCKRFSIERIEATTTVEVIQELVHVRGRRRDRADAADVGRDFADLLAPLLTVSYVDLIDGMVIYARNDRLGAFDSVLVAAAVRHGAGALVSADRGFSSGIDIRHVVPDAGGVAALLN